GLFLFLFSTAKAGVTPLSVGIFPPVQFPPQDFTITGVRASVLWGKHRSIYGLDFGVLGNITEQEFVGIGLSGMLNYTEGSTTVLGLQAAGIANMNKGKTRIYGVQVALGLNYQTVVSSVAGLQLALANICPFTDVYGFQVGLYNKAL